MRHHHHLPPCTITVWHGRPRTEPQWLNFGVSAPNLLPCFMFVNAQPQHHLHFICPIPPPFPITPEVPRGPVRHIHAVAAATTAPATMWQHQQQQQQGYYGPLPLTCLFFYFFFLFFQVIFTCIYNISIQRNCGYQRYHRFRRIPCKWQVMMGITHHG